MTVHYQNELAFTLIFAVLLGCHLMVRVTGRYWFYSLAEMCGGRSLDFEVDSHHIPDGFLRIDISSAHARHLLLASDAQLYLLSKAKTWYACTVFSIFAVIQHKFIIT